MKKIALLIAGLALSGTTHADFVNVRITGTLLTPSCEINGGNDINVDFGTLRTDKIDGTANSKPLNVNLTCQNHSNYTVQLRVNQAGATGNTLKTDQSGLGISLKRNGVAQALNTWFTPTSLASPGLTLTPVKLGTLTDGAFSASGTVEVQIL